MIRLISILTWTLLLAAACSRNPVPQQPASPQNVPPSAAVGSSSLSAGERDQFLEAISTQIMPRPVWISVSANDAQGRALAESFADVFREARWDVKEIRELNFTLKNGIFFMVGEDEVPAYVLDAYKGLEAAGFKPTLGSGYRSFYAQMKQKNPSWNGIPLEKDQIYVIGVSGDRKNAEPVSPPK